MHILRMHHIAIICSDYEHSMRFDTEVLRLNIIAVVDRAARDSYKLDRRLPDGVLTALLSFPN